MMQGTDIRELSFQNVVDQILKPNNVNIGGIPDNIFLELSETEKETLICNICFLIVNDARHCKNEHLFCRTCIFAWSLTYGENSQKCPMCRNDQDDYEECKKVNKLLNDKRVACPEDGCNFKAPLKIFLMHGHGKTKYSNSHVDFDSIRPPARPDGARLLVLPNLTISGSNPRERAYSIRNQLQQGRMMIHQMMLLLHLEMQLRQQALTGFQEATDPHTRLSRLDEVMALNEQLNEVGTVLSTLMNSPINSIIAANRVIRELDTSTSQSRAPTFETLLATTGRDSPRFDDDDDDDDDTSDSSDESSVVTALRREAVDRRRTLTVNRTTNTSTSSSLNIGAASSNLGDRSLRRSEIRQSLLADRSNETREINDDDIPSISQARHLPDYAQASMPNTDLHPRVLMGRSQVSNRNVSRPNADNNGTNVTVETTQRLGSASANRTSGSRNNIQTTVNSRNQTLPSVNSLGSNISQTSGTAQRSLGTHTPRPPSSQPSEANLPDTDRTVIPSGSSTYTQVRNSLHNNRSDTTGVRNGQNRNGNTSISWHSGSNTGSTPRPNSVARANTNSVAGANTAHANRNSIGSQGTTPVSDSNQTPRSDDRTTFRTSIRGNEVGNISNPSGPRRVLSRSQENSNTINTSSREGPSTQSGPTRTTTVVRRGNNTEYRSPSRLNASLTQNTSQRSRIENRVVVPRRRSTSNSTSTNSISQSQTSGNSNPYSINQTANTSTVRPRPPLNQSKNTSPSRNGTQRTTTNSQGPLLRARRRSEIKQDLMNPTQPK